MHSINIVFFVYVCLDFSFQGSLFLSVWEMASCHSRVWSEAQENSSGRLMTLTSVSNRPGWSFAMLSLSFAHFAVKLPMGISEPGFWEIEPSNDKTDYCRWELAFICVREYAMSLLAIKIRRVDIMNGGCRSKSRQQVLFCRHESIYNDLD